MTSKPIMTGELVVENLVIVVDKAGCCGTRSRPPGATSFVFFFGGDHKFHLQTTTCREFLTTTAKSVSPCNTGHQIVVGTRVFVRGHGEAVLACLKQDQATKAEWHAGVVFDKPVGDCDGKFLGVRFFQCSPRHGLVVPLRDVRSSPWPEEAVELSSAASSSDRAGSRKPAGTPARKTSLASRARRFDYPFALELVNGVKLVFAAPTFWEMQQWVFELSMNLLCVTPGDAAAAAPSAQTVSRLLAVPSDAPHSSSGVPTGPRYMTITLPMLGTDATTTLSATATVTSSGLGSGSATSTPPHPSSASSVPAVEGDLPSLAAAFVAAFAVAADDGRPSFSPELAVAEPATDSGAAHGWNWGAISRETAEEALVAAVRNGHALDGLFLLREKSDSKDLTVVSVLADGMFSHVLINDLMSRAGTTLSNGAPFSSSEKTLPRMVEFLRSPRPNIGWLTPLTAFLQAGTHSVVVLPPRLASRMPSELKLTGSGIQTPSSNVSPPRPSSASSSSSEPTAVLKVAAPTGSSTVLQPVLLVHSQATAQVREGASAALLTPPPLPYTSSVTVDYSEV